MLVYILYVYFFHFIFIQFSKTFYIRCDIYSRNDTKKLKNEFFTLLLVAENKIPNAKQTDENARRKKYILLIFRSIQLKREYLFDKQPLVIRHKC